MITNSLEVAATATTARAQDAAVTVRGVRKNYGSVQAVDGVDLTVRRGEVLALLGPNGAGKTSLVEILEGHRVADAGEISVLGHDPAKRERAFRERIGIVLQEEGLEENLTVAEMIELYGAPYPNPRPADEIIELVGLTEQRDKRAGTLSGGQRRRLDLAVGITGDPELIFLDEPTTGFDPAARRRSWELIADLKDLGKTILLTTHYMEEAQFLADRVVVIAKGRVIAEGTPDTLGRGQAEAALVTFRTPAGFDASELPLPEHVELAHNGATLSFRTPTPTADLAPLFSWAAVRGLELDGLAVTRPTLEDVYLQLTQESA
jgi:ABC-2 type transport system ATP-binding protein